MSESNLRFVEGALQTTFPDPPKPRTDTGDLLHMLNSLLQAHADLKRQVDNIERIQRLRMAELPSHPNLSIDY